MANPNPINPNPGVTPVSPTPQYGEGKPMVGAGETQKETKPFSIEPEAGAKGQVVAGAEATGKPSPMQAAQEAGQAKPWTPEEMNTNINKAQDTLSNAKSLVNDPAKTQDLTEEHMNALGQLTDKMSGDMRSVANNSGQEYTPVSKESDESMSSYVSRWIDGSQATFGGALNYLSNQDPTKAPDMTSYLKLQMSVQRASERGELFAGIIGASVSGVKTIMSVQLG